MSETASGAPARTALAGLTALGIVYGDLGTSPLYTMQTILQAVGGRVAPEAALGILSLIFWALALTISLKYCVFVMRADNHGEGGILALMSLIGANRFDNKPALVVMGLFGAALIYGDGIITPAISVLSALEGTEIALPEMRGFVLPLAIIILFGLFAIQHFGTARIGGWFGPIMLVWFITMAALGLPAIARHPEVLWAVDPRHAIRYLASGGWGGFAVLGGVFLAITGGEALYADMGHIGRTPIRFAWYGVVLPALLVNYAGQTALLMERPDLKGNPFFHLAPDWAVLPLVGLATIATIIASQAIITGAFSLTRQGMQLGWFPGLRIRQTSADEYGQIYVSVVNWLMMAFTIGLAAGFGSSDRLAGAYGTAVSTTMWLTTALLFEAMRRRWGWPLIAALPLSALFLVIDLGFFSANLLKIADGGWIPLCFGAAIFAIMVTWRLGMDAMRAKLSMASVAPATFRQYLADGKIPRVPGTAIFLTRTLEAIPEFVARHAAEMGALPAEVIALTVRFEPVPRVDQADRLGVMPFFAGIRRISVHFGFMEVPDLPAALARLEPDLGPIDLAGAMWFAGRDTILPAHGTSRPRRLRVNAFAFLFRNAVHSVDLFRLPRDRFIEIGHLVEI